MANARAVATAIADLVVLAEPRLAGVKYALALVVALTDRSADQLREVSDHLERQTGASLATGLMQLSDASDLENERARERQLEHATDTLYAAWIDVSEVRKHPRSRELMAAAAGLGVAWAARGERKLALRYLQLGADHAHDLRFALDVSAIGAEMDAATYSALLGHKPGGRTRWRYVPSGRQVARIYFAYGLPAVRDYRRARAPYQDFRHLRRQRRTGRSLSRLGPDDRARPLDLLPEAGSMAGALDDACRSLDPGYDRQVQCARCGHEFWLDRTCRDDVACAICGRRLMAGPASRTIPGVLGLEPPPGSTS